MVTGAEVVRREQKVLSYDDFILLFNELIEDIAATLIDKAKSFTLNEKSTKPTKSKILKLLTALLNLMHNEEKYFHQIGII